MLLRRSILAGLVLGALAGCATTPHGAQSAAEFPMVPAQHTGIAVRPRPPEAPPTPFVAAPAAQPAASFRVLDPVPAAPADLFARLRDGYGLAEVDDVSIDRQLKFFASKPQFLDRTFARGERYLYYEVQELEARHMPLELALLPVIESAYNPYAYSRARAAGIWQFITPTATRHQVRVNWWQDGRRDIMDSTRAALDYLSELNTMFNGDWLLAIAAYNCGEMAVLRAVQRNQAAGLPIDFWHLKLPTETRGYVPSLLAMARLVRNPSAYGLDFEPLPNKPYFASVEVGGPIDLRVAAALLEVSEEEMHALNPAFNRWATDPEGPFALLVPAESARAFADASARLSADQRLPVEHHTVAAKETLTSIAKARNLPLPIVQQLNGSAHFTARVGDAILLPATQLVAPLKAGLMIEGETTGTGKHSKAAAIAHHHVVRHGETLASIAKKNHLKVANLAQMNGLQPESALKPGRQLTVASASTTTDAAHTPRASQDHRAANTAAVREVRYQVKHGDTLHGLTQKFAVTLAQLKAWNRIGKTLTVGQMIVIKVPADKDYGG